MALRKNSVSALLVTFHISTLSRTLASLGLPSTSETLKGIPSGSTKSTGNSKVSWSTAKYWVVDGNVCGRLTKGTKQRNSIRDTLKLRLQNYHDDFVTVKVCNYANPTWLGFVHMYEHCFSMCALRVSIVFPLSHDFPRVTCGRWSTLKSKQVSCIYMWVQAVDSEVKTGFLLCETLQTLEPRSIHSWLKKDHRKSFATIRANSVAMHATIIELMLYLQVSAHPVVILLY